MCVLSFMNSESAVAARKRTKRFASRNASRRMGIERGCRTTASEATARLRTSRDAAYEEGPETRIPLAVVERVGASGNCFRQKGCAERDQGISPLPGTDFPRLLKTGVEHSICPEAFLKP